MDKKLITHKLESLRKYMHRVEQKRPSSPDELHNNLDLQDIISVNLERAVQLCVDIGAHIISHSEFDAPTSLGETFDILEKMDVLSSHTSIQLKKAVGFRNIAVHAYQKLDWDIVYYISNEGLNNFKSLQQKSASILIRTDRVHFAVQYWYFFTQMRNHSNQHKTNLITLPSSPGFS